MFFLSDKWSAEIKGTSLCNVLTLTCHRIGVYLWIKEYQRGGYQWNGQSICLFSLSDMEIESCANSYQNFNQIYYTLNSKLCQITSLLACNVHMPAYEDKKPPQNRSGPNKLIHTGYHVQNSVLEGCSILWKKN